MREHSQARHIASGSAFQSTSSAPRLHPDHREIVWYDAFIRVLFEQRLEVGARLVAIPREDIPLPHLIRTLPPREWGAVVHHIADEVERVDVATHLIT